MTDFSALFKLRRGPMIQVPTSELTLGLDPGNTTGWCRFMGLELQQAGDLPTPPKDLHLRATNIRNLILGQWQASRPVRVICEDYRIYAHKLAQHTNSDVVTLRLIGMIEYICAINNIPLYFQMAATAKPFCTDKKLRDWGFYQQAPHHARDAIRHVCYYLLFNNEMEAYHV